jgi:MoxR-like ATPase
MSDMGEQTQASARPGAAAPEASGVVQRFVAAVRDGVQQVMIGKTETIELAIAALLARGHVLIEDVPGTGKTTLAKALAATMQCDFTRIQFTPDLVPADVLGVNFFDLNERQFEFRAGPVFTQILLADEINRATPRTQSALLEAMQERQVSIDGVTMALPTPFFVVATLNPIEMEGTFPLPEAQLDRFLLRLDLGYPSPLEEAAMLDRFAANSVIPAAAPVVGPEDIRQAQTAVDNVKVDGAVRDYLLAIVGATRDDERLRLGASPRAALALQRASQAYAAIDGRGYVIPDDIKTLAVPVLAHRVNVDSGPRLRGVTAAGIVEEILDRIAVPIEG